MGRRKTSFANDDHREPCSAVCAARGYLQTRRNHDLRVQAVAGTYRGSEARVRKSGCASSYGRETPRTSRIFTTSYRTFTIKTKVWAMVRLKLSTPPAGVSYAFPSIILQGASRLQGITSLLSASRAVNKRADEPFQRIPCLRTGVPSVIRSRCASDGLDGGYANFGSGVYKSWACASGVMAVTGIPPFGRADGASALSVFRSAPDTVEKFR